MALPVRQQLIYWGIAAVALVWSSCGRWAT
jgi:hypothetical protein